MSTTVARRETKRNRGNSENRLGGEPAYEIQDQVTAATDGTPASSATDRSPTAGASATGTQPAAAGGGRDGRGRFAAGNVGGPGNPFARQTAQLRSALIQRVTLEDINVIADELILRARMGKLEAIKLLFQYVIGKPTVAVNPDTLDVEEFQQIYAPRKEIWELASESVQCVPPRQCSAFMDVGNEAARMAMVDMLRGTDTAEPKTGAMNRRNPEDTRNHERDEAVSQASSEKGANGAAVREENGRPPSTNRTGGNGVKRPSTNGPGPDNGRQNSRGQGDAGRSEMPGVRLTGGSEVPTTGKGGAAPPSTNGEKSRPASGIPVARRAP